MKRVFISSYILIGLLFLTKISSVHAQMGTMMGLDNEEIQTSSGEEHTESVEVVLQNILDSQNVTTVQQLDLSKVTDDQWEALGDAVMELQHPGQAHEAMDQMMGGEGSELLKQMHINMGKAYLGYGDTNYGPGSMMNGYGGMMGNRSFDTNQLQGGSMMGLGTMGFSSMMGYSGYSIFGLITWIIVLLFLGSGIYYFIKQANKK